MSEQDLIVSQIKQTPQIAVDQLISPKAIKIKKASSLMRAIDDRFAANNSINEIEPWAEEEQFSDGSHQIHEAQLEELVTPIYKKGKSRKIKQNTEEIPQET